MHSSTITLSLSRWLELPLYSFDDWKKEKSRDEEEEGRRKDGKKRERSSVRKLRASARDIADYYSSYVARLKLEKNFQTGFTVTRVEELLQRSLCSFTDLDIWSCCAACEVQDSGIYCFEVFSCERKLQRYRWRLVAISEGKELVVKAKKLVLACGLGKPRRLEVSGENLPFVVHDLSELHRRMPVLSATARPIVVIGAGISAADAILAALKSSVPVYHVFRQKATAESLFQKLPRGAYKEYHEVWSLMQRRIQSPLYTPFEEHAVESFSLDGRCLLKCLANGKEEELDVSAAVVLIGSHANLNFLPTHLRTSLGCHPGIPIDSKWNPMDVNLFTSQSEKCSDLYALGPLVGDNFVRFVFGSALGSAQSILQLAPQSEISQVQ